MNELNTIVLKTQNGLNNVCKEHEIDATLNTLIHVIDKLFGLQRDFSFPAQCVWSP